MADAVTAMDGDRWSLTTYVRWTHDLGPAHCLARYHETSDGAVCVLSELRSNDRYRSMMHNLPGVAAAVLGLMAEHRHAADPARIGWIAHFGDFSSYDPSGYAETFTDVRLHWEGGKYHDDIARHVLLDAESTRSVLGGLIPVPQVVRQLGPPT